MSYKWYKVYHGDDQNAYGHEVNQVRTIGAGKHLICLARTEKGFFAVDDKCPHASGRLGRGKCENGYIICPVHRYKYMLDTGRGAPGQGDFVETYPVRIDENGLFVGIKQRSWWRLW